MLTGENRAEIVFLIEEMNEQKREHFQWLGNGGRYTTEQKQYAFEMIREHGVRGTARILNVSRRTLQRWCRKHHVYVKRCPDWVFEWAEKRRKRREFWALRGY